MLVNKNRISFITTVSNFELYKKTSIYYPSHINRYVIDGRGGMYGLDSIIFMMKKLKDKDIDWLIMIDEDGILIDYDNVIELIDYMDENKFIISGMQDGGVNPIRHHSPIAINTYFSIINFQKLKQIWNVEQILANQYINKDEFKLFNKFLKYRYDLDSVFEKYYCFYFWILRNGHKILYLNAENSIEGDDSTNVLFNHLNKPMMYHTWYARLYGNSKGHTERINNVIKIRNKIKKCKSKYVKPIIYKDKTFRRNVGKSNSLIVLKKKIKKLIKTFFFDV